MKSNKEISPTQRALNIWAIVVLIWSLYRFYFKTELPLWFDEFIAKPSIFLLPLFYYITRYEKKNFLQAIDFKTKKIEWDALFGLLIGLFFFATGMFSHWSKYGTYLPTDRVLSTSYVFYVSFISLASSVSEEILSRGFILKRLYEESKNIITSSFFASFLFFFLHVPILFSDPKMSGTILIQVMITDLILSLAVSLLYLQRRNVILPILIHAFYNLSIYLFIR